MTVDIFQTFSGAPMYGGEIEQGSQTRSTGCHEEVGGDFQLRGNRESWSAKEVHDEGANCASLGDGYEGLVEMGIIEAKEFEGYSFGMTRRGGQRKRDDGKVVEGDGTTGCRYTVDVRSSGANIVRWGGDEDLDRERRTAVKYKLSQLYHGDKVADGRRRIQNYGILHDCRLCARVCVRDRERDLRPPILNNLPLLGYEAIYSQLPTILNYLPFLRSITYHSERDGLVKINQNFISNFY